MIRRQSFSPRKSSTLRPPRVNDPRTWKLSLDIILYILSDFVQDEEDIIAVMRVCPALYSAGVQPFLVRHGTVHISTTYKLHSLWRFMSSNGRQGYTGLQGFAFDVETPLFDYDLDHLRWIFTKATNLKELRLHTNTLSRSQDLPWLISDLKHLRILDCRGPYDANLVFVLSRLCSPLVKVDIPLKDRDPISLLSGFCESLEEITVSSAAFSSSINKSLVYPKVVSLNILACERPILPHLVIAFPNLKWLAIDSENGPKHGGKSGKRTGSDINSLRTASLKFQQCWGALDFLSVDITRLYLLGLRCKVRYLWLLGTLDDSTEHILWFRSSLASIGPTRLRLEVNTRHLNPASLHEVFAAGMEELRRLDLIVDPQSPAACPEDILDALFVAMKRLRLHVLDVRIPWSIIGPQNAPPEGCLNFCESPSERNMKELRVKALAKRALEAAPTLCFIVFEFLEADRDPLWKKYWSVTVTTARRGKRKLVDITEEEGERLRTTL